MWQSGKFIAEFIQKKKLLVNVVDRTRRTPLHYAATYCNMSAARALIDNGTAIDMKDSNGMTPLHAALREGNFEMIYRLIKLGADMTQ
jgi:ankyrin repeat protein